MRMAVQSGETTGVRVAVAGKPKFRAGSDLLLSHEMAGHISALARKEAVSFRTHSRKLVARLDGPSVRS